MVETADKSDSGEGYLRILMLSPQFYPLVGGYERAAERLSAALAARGHTVTVITERRDFSWPARDHLSGVQVRRLCCLYRPHLHMITSITAFALFLLTQGRRYQVWHIHQYGMHAVLAVAMGKLLRRSVVLKLTSSNEQGLSKATETLPFPSFARFLLRKIDAVVATTSETQVEAEVFGIDSFRVHVLGNGVDVHHFRPQHNEELMHLRQKLNIDAAGVIVFVGRLSPEKNPDGLLHAWKKASANLPDGWKLVLVGDGPMREQLEMFAKTEGLITSVVFAGRQSNVETWMAAANIFVLPSHREGLSNSMLEAMASGLPVVSTRVSGSTEIVEETGAGILVDVGRMDLLSDALNQLAQDASLREKMGNAGRAVIKNKHSIEQVATAHLELYRDILISARQGRNT